MPHRVDTDVNVADAMPKGISNPRMEKLMKKAWTEIVEGSSDIALRAASLPVTTECDVQCKRRGSVRFPVHDKRELNANEAGSFGSGATGRPCLGECLARQTDRDPPTLTVT